jgi:hypothetical protein
MFKSKAAEKDTNSAANAAEVVGRTARSSRSSAGRRHGRGWRVGSSRRAPSSPRWCAGEFSKRWRWLDIFQARRTADHSVTEILH